MATPHQLTKKERVKLAREVRRLAGLYILFQQQHIQVENVDWQEIAWERLGDAAVALSDLIEREREIRGNKP
jgi:hypothetical protein